jgi:saccharopine dehydrogenase-like NADP-dependent oxidoreductase
MKKVIVLGAGMVGSTMAKDLAADFTVTILDIDIKKLNAVKRISQVSVIQQNILEIQKLQSIIKDFDLVFSAVPGHFGYKTLKSIIEAKKDVVDISFFEEDPFRLYRLAVKNKVTAVIDCGIAPGLSNIILGYYNKRMKIKSYDCYVGGLPFKRIQPFEYKAPFSPVDVIEEYSRNARFVVNGKIKIKPALTDIELSNIPPAGMLEAFNTDGLRTLIQTMKIPNMKEKTLRYPGHAEKMKMLSDAGFFNKNYIEVDGKKIRPVDLSTKLLFPLWNLKKGEKEFTILKIKMRGQEKNRNKDIEFILYDKYDEKNRDTSMARATGFTCTSVVRLLAAGAYKRKGIIAPEMIGKNEDCFRFVLGYLSKKGIELRFEEKIY